MLQLPKLSLFFKPYSRSYEKQKLLNKENSIFFIYSTGIKVIPDANRNQDNQEQSIGRSKGG